jgi:hypothetical protein
MYTSGKRGRPRKYPKIEPLDLDHMPVPPTAIVSASPAVSIDTAAIAIAAGNTTPAVQGGDAADSASDGQPQADALARRSGDKSRPFQCITCAKTFTLKGKS